MFLDPLLASGSAIQLHTAAAFIAAVSGFAVLLMHKGTAAHRRTGYVFVAAMIVTAFTSFAITSLIPGRFSPIHILSVITLVSIPMGIFYRRQGNLRAHALCMISPLAGLLIAGAFTLLPGRIMYQVVFGP